MKERLTQRKRKQPDSPKGGDAERTDAFDELIWLLEHGAHLLATVPVWLTNGTAVAGTPAFKRVSSS
jgi:hypothetical protein